MLDKEKKRFHEMAEKDKARYDLEMQNYVPPKGVVIGRGKKRKQIKDPNAPKRSLYVTKMMILSLACSEIFMNFFLLLFVLSSARHSSGSVMMNAQK